MQNIFGIILFIRMPNITGSAGVLVATAIVGTCCLTTFLTSLSVSALSTIGRVPAGGPYYILSRAVGPEFGGAVIFFFYLGTSVASAMYIVGAVEVLQDNVPPLHPGFWLPCSVCQVTIDGTLHSDLDCGSMGQGLFANFSQPLKDLTQTLSVGSREPAQCVHSYDEIRVFGGLLSVCMVLFVSLGVELVSAVAPYFLYVVFFAIAMIYIGMLSTLIPGFRTEPIGGIGGLTGFSMANFKENFYYPAGFCVDCDDYTKNVQYLYGLFFPSVTGIMAGCNRSGDLKDPSKSIPRGTISANARPRPSLSFFVLGLPHVCLAELRLADRPSFLVPGSPHACRSLTLAGDHVLRVHLHGYNVGRAGLAHGPHGRAIPLLHRAADRRLLPRRQGDRGGRHAAVVHRRRAAGKY